MGEVDVRGIVAGLTKAQREILKRGSFPSWQRERREDRTKSVLVRKGLATFTHVIAGRGDYRLTPAGLAVRQALQEGL